MGWSLFWQGTIQDCRGIGANGNGGQEDMSLGQLESFFGKGPYRIVVVLEPMEMEDRKI